MASVIYYRDSLFQDELSAANNHFKCTDLLSDIPKGSFVIPRYSTVPFIKNVFKEFSNLNLTPINSLSSSLWIMDLANWVECLGKLTPRTWDRLQDIPDEGPFVLKGATNSKKHYWNTHMFAANKKEAIRVYGLLSEDCMIGEQKIYIRKYEPLVTLMEGINGIPVTKEFRLFFYGEKLLCSGFYWQNYEEDVPYIPEMDAPDSFIAEVARKIHLCSGANFYVVDIGQKIDGSWMVIEVNQGEMSGLSCIDPKLLYRRLKEECLKRYLG